MRIVQLLPELNEGGVERGVVELSRELVKLGHDSIVISNGGKLVKNIVDDGGEHIEFDVCSKNPLTLMQRVSGLKKIIDRIKPDILHARSRVPAWITYLSKKDIPFITTVHGFNSVNFYSKIMTKGDRVICVSKSIKEYIQKHYNTDEERIVIIPRGIDTDKFNLSNLDKEFIEDFKKKYGLDKRLIISTVGRITELKDIETFIHSLYLLQKRYSDIVGLVIGGVREDKKNYFQKLKELTKTLKANIIFTGSQSKVAEIYALSDVVVSSSKKPESFGRSVAEAIALNTPVIATNHGGVKDIVIDGKNGYLVNIGDKEQMAKKIELAMKLRFDGYNYIKTNFSLKQMVLKSVEVYKKVYYAD